MAKQRKPQEVLSHWSKLVEGMEASPMEFYASVEKAIEVREIPEVAMSRIEWSEGGVLSSKREYLRAERREHIIDICGAPFGKAFFFSSWLAMAPPRVSPLHVVIALVVFGGLGALLGDRVGLVPGLILLFVLVFVLLMIARRGSIPYAAEIETLFTKIPIIGPLYARFFIPATYYKQDTANMFYSAVHQAMMDVIDETTNAKGVRALTEDDRKPIMKDFFKR